jgi:hypothetical protein
MNGGKGQGVTRTMMVMVLTAVATGWIVPAVQGLSYNPEIFTIEPNFTGLGATEGYFTAGGYVVWLSTPSLALTGYELAKRESFAVAPAGAVDAVSTRMNESYFAWRDWTAKQLYAFDLAKRELIPVGPGDMDGSTIALAGRYLCWLGTTDQTLYGFDLAARERFVIASGDIDSRGIRGAGDYFVYKNSKDYTLYGYHLPTREAFVISAGDMETTFEGMNERVAVTATRSMQHSGMSGFDLVGRRSFPIVEGDWAMVLSIQGDFILWSGYFLYPGLWACSISTGQSFQITTDPVTPKANERYVVWNSNSRIYGYDLATRQTIDTGVESMAIPMLSGSIFYRLFNYPDLPKYEIRGYDLATGEAFTVCPWSYTVMVSPKAEGDYFIWADSVPVGTPPQLFAARIWKVPNDTCEDAVEVTAGTAYRGDSSGATGTDLTDCGSGDWRDVWHVFQPAEGGEYTIDAGSAALDTTLAVLSDCSSDAVLACNDNRDSKTGDSRLEVTLEKDQRYLIRVAGVNGSAGLYELMVKRGVCKHPPQADLDGDCRVNLADLAIVSSQWMSCGLEPAELCQ